MSLRLLCPSARQRCLARPLKQLTPTTVAVAQNESFQRNLQALCARPRPSDHLGQCRLTQSKTSTPIASTIPPDPTPDLLIPESGDGWHEDDFPKNSGFWQSPAANVDAELSESLLGGSRDDVSKRVERPLLRKESTPSRQIHAALKALGFNALIPKVPAGKVDLSFFSFTSIEANRRQGSQNLDTIAPTSTIRFEHIPQRLEDILSSYLTYVSPVMRSPVGDQSPQYEEAIATVFSRESRLLLQRRKYEPEDVVIWEWILASDSADEAAERLSSISGELRERDREGVPLFLPLLILRSNHLRASSLRNLMSSIWCKGVSATGATEISHYAPRLPEEQAIILVVRLIRHARKVWPEAFQDIALATTKLIRLSTDDMSSIRPKRVQRMCYLYNRLLSLLSIPCSAHPFRSVPLQQQAQLHIVRHMIESEPQLHVTREGFRALARVQVAHKKTEQEREWAHYQAASWPPWKEDKSGVDAGREFSGQQSRAMDVLLHLTEAGYSQLPWDQKIQIFAGWDTDKSPVIQTRHLLRSPGTFSIDQINEEYSAEKDPEIWAARISSTRTVKEAWACFCSFNKELNSPSLEPWHAMFEKLALAGQEKPAGNVVAGDGLEPFPEPISPHDFLYVPSEPPSLDELYKSMRLKGLVPSGRLLAVLLGHAPTLQHGLTYLLDSQFSEIKVDVLLHAEKYAPGFIRKILEDLPPYIFSAYVRLLSRFPTTGVPHLYSPGSASSVRSMNDQGRSNGFIRPLRQSRTISPLAYATELVEISETQYRPVWNTLFAAICQYIDLKSDPRRLTDRVLEGWIILRRLLQAQGRLDVPSDLHGFCDICLIFVRMLRQSPNPRFIQASGFPDSIRMADYTNSAAKMLFRSIVADHRGMPVQPWLPKEAVTDLLEVPSPYILYCLIRALGSAGDRAGLMELLRWMSAYAPQLAAVSTELANGQKQVLLNMVNLRILLERSWERDVDALSPGDSPYSAEASEIIERHESWGGWPSEDVVREYVSKFYRRWHTLPGLEYVTRER